MPNGQINIWNPPALVVWMLNGWRALSQFCSEDGSTYVIQLVPVNVELFSWGLVIPDFVRQETR